MEIKMSDDDFKDYPNVRLDSKEVMVQCELEFKLKYLEWTKLIPYLKFPNSWYVKVVPPFGRAMARFFVSKSPDSKNRVSVYLDCYDNLGYMGYPYWEVYPYKNDEGIFRCHMEETDKLMKAISVSLKKWG